MVNKNTRKILNLICATDKAATLLKLNHKLVEGHVELVNEIAQKASKHLGNMISEDILTVLHKFPAA